MDLVSKILEESSKESNKYKSIHVEKHLKLDFDLGTLLAIDTNDIDKNAFRTNPEDYLLNLTRDNTQLLLNEIWELPSERVEEVIVAKLPPQKTLLPRSKPVPKPRSLTKWEKFAKEKGIQKKKKSKLAWDEQLKKWIPMYGFKRARAQHEKDWVLEVPQNANPDEDQFAKKVHQKNERVAKNELQRLRNIAKARNVKVPRVGLLNPENSSAKDLQTAITVAKSSTASVGKFQNKLPHEKEARGVAAITPGASSRKRKLPPISGSEEKSANLAVVDSILNKRPKIDVGAYQTHARPAEPQTQEQPARRSKGGKKNKTGKPMSAKKPKGGRGQRKGKEAGGRKRR